MSLRKSTESEMRVAGARHAALHATLLRVYRAAKAMSAGMDRVERGVYRVDPESVLGLRTAVAAAASVVRRETK